MNPEEAFDILKKIQNAGNIHIPEKAKLKSELITELEEIIPLSKQKEIKKLRNTSILFLGNVKEAILAGCYSHCLRNITFGIDLLAPYRLYPKPELTKDEIDSFYNSTSEGKLIYKDCYGQYLETIWLKDDDNYFSDDLYYLRNTGIKEWLNFLKQGITVFLTRLEGKDTCECKQFVKILESLKSRSDLQYPLFIHANDKNDLPKYFTRLFDDKVIELEPEKQSKAGDIPQDEPKTEASSVVSETVFFDDKKGYIWLSSEKKEKLEPEDAKIFQIVIEIFNNGQSHCRIEQIIESLCGKTIGFQQKITNNSAYKKCKSAFSTINAKFRKLLNTNDIKIKLIKSDGQRNIVLLKHVVLRELFRKTP